MVAKWCQNQENLILEPRRWPRGAQDGIFYDFVVNFGISFGTPGARVSALLRSVFFHVFHPEQHLADLLSILGVILEPFASVLGRGGKYGF